MDFTFDETQEGVADLAKAILAREAGPERARAVLAGDGFDFELEESLTNAGLLDLAGDDDAGPLEATLVVEAASAHSAVIAAGARALVAPALGLEISGPIALASQEQGQALRFAALEPKVLLLSSTSAWLAEVAAVDPRGPMAPYGVARADLRTVEELPSGADVLLRRWWRISLAVEVAGTAQAAFELTLQHLQSRIQFDRPLASLQAIQHRLAEVEVSIEATRWLARYAAYQSEDDAAAASAAASAASTARVAIWELHQLHGAVGFTKEYDLHLLTMRLHELRLQLDGVAGAHDRDVADLRWQLSSSESPLPKVRTATRSPMN